ncbi:SMP-30/gluconolactonase/LRE family protein [Shewanella sp. 3_MG-2023]|uniref:SMP-30/gluconolactonase/LRE family protein n=1 Tax=Shewanella sp. 3_MG-2023 TaxID=3062635 RepID=UPI0026E3512B|nr:SMP-30/gluconolactonase/LRE family protein [Shewanella sp. 3_MG-2023]MDO6775653.1 SMP-30/gluconolactonase/LRE family protein [Shewanella sp. 3_MG-2023]
MGKGTFIIISSLLLMACSSNSSTISANKAHINTLEQKPFSKSKASKIQSDIYTIYSNEALSVLDTSQPINVLANGFEWVEGPVWSVRNNGLLFSDIPKNIVYLYHHQHGLTEYLENSGFSNGLVISQNKTLILMQSRSRQIAKMRSTLNMPRSEYEVLADSFQGKRLNSPNDGVLASNGSLLFTDPPYGLVGKLNDPAKELSFQGVYKLDKNKQLTLIDDSILYPNGIALSADQRTLYVAASDPSKPTWYQYQLDENLLVMNKKVFYELSAVRDDSHGLPDGLKIHQSGIIFATGPKGIFLFNPSGKLLARINLPSIAANVAFNEDYSMLYITAHHQLLAIKLNQ